MADLPNIFEDIEKGAKSATSEMTKLNQVLEKTRRLSSGAGQAVKNVGGRALSFLQPLEIGGSIAGGQGALRSTSRSITEYGSTDYALKAATGWETWGKTMERVADRAVRSSSRISQALGKLSQVSARASQVAFNPAVIGVSAVISAYYELSASAKRAADEVEKHNKRLQYAFQGMGGAPSGLLQSAGIAARQTGMSRAQAMPFMAQAGAAGFGASDSQRIVRIAHAIAREQGQEIAKVIGGVIQNASLATSGMTSAQTSDYLQRQALVRTNIYARPTLQQELERTGRYGILQARGESLRADARYERYVRPAAEGLTAFGQTAGYLATGGPARTLAEEGQRVGNRLALGVVGQINRGRAVNAFYDVGRHADALQRRGQVTKARQLREQADRGLRDIEIERLSQQTEDESSRFIKSAAVVNARQRAQEALNKEKQIASIDKQLQTGTLTDDQAKTLRRKRARLSIEAGEASRDAETFQRNLGFGGRLRLAFEERVLGKNYLQEATQGALNLGAVGGRQARLETEKEQEFKTRVGAYKDRFYETFSPDKVEKEIKDAEKRVIDLAENVSVLSKALAQDDTNKQLKEDVRKAEDQLAGAQKNLSKKRGGFQDRAAFAITQAEFYLRGEEERVTKDSVDVMKERLSSLGILEKGDVARIQRWKDTMGKRESSERTQRLLQLRQRQSQDRVARFETGLVGRTQENTKDNIRLTMDSLGMRGNIRGSDREQVERLLERGDETSLQQARTLIGVVRQEAQTRMARVDYAVTREQRLGQRRLTLASIGTARRRGIISGGEAANFRTAAGGTDLEQEQVNRILQIKEEAFQREIDFTTKYTQARLNIISAHYEKARGLEELRLYGAERQQSPFLQFGQRQFQLGEIGRGAQATAFQVAEQQLSQARTARGFRRARRDLVLGFSGAQLPRGAQFVENLQRLNEQEGDFRRRQQQQISMDTSGFRNMADTLQSLRQQNISEEDLRKTSGGRQFLLQMYQQNQAGFERAGVGDQARSRINSLIQGEREFARRQLKLQLRQRELTKEETEKKVGVLEQQLSETPEGERRNLVQANLAGTYKEAAAAAKERGDIQAYEEYMGKYESAIEKLPEYLKGAYDDANKITNELLVTQNRILEAIGSALGAELPADRSSATGIETSPDTNQVGAEGYVGKVSKTFQLLDSVADKLKEVYGNAKIEVTVDGPGTARLKSGSGSYSPTGGGS